MSNGDGSERRAHDRVPADARVELFYEGDALGPYAAVNVSEGGIQIKGFSLPVLARVRLVVNFPEGPSNVMVDGTIAWRSVGRSGIRFVDMSPAAEGLMREAVARREPS